MMDMKRHLFIVAMLSTKKNIIGLFHVVIIFP